MDYMSNITSIVPHNTQIFNFQDNQIRIKIIDGKEYFCAKDVCDALCYSTGKDIKSLEKYLLEFFKI